MDEWAYENGVVLHFIEAGKPTQNAYIESFSGKLRDECLNQSWFVRLANAREVMEAWRVGYNTVRPHSWLGYQTPEEFGPKPPRDRRLLPRRSLPSFQREQDQTCRRPRVLHHDWSKNGGQVR